MISNQFVNLVMATSLMIAGAAQAAPSARKASFCQNLTQGLSDFAVSRGSTAASAKRWSALQTRGIVAQLKSGPVDEYLNVSSLSSESASNRPEDRMWLSLPELMVRSMGGSASRVLLISDVNDLKMMTHVMPEMQILIVIADAGVLTPERVRMVSEAAVNSKVRLHVLWTASAGKGRLGSLNLKDLRALAEDAGGSFVDLGATQSCPGA